MKSLFFSLTLLLCITTLSAQTKYYMDIHKLEPGKVHYHDVAGAHEKDLATQEKYGVKFLTYWVDEAGGTVYCLSSAKQASDVSSTHSEAHGLVPHEIYEVVSGEQAAYSGNGALYLDIHELTPGAVSPADVEVAHQKDLAVQGNHKVHFVNYWIDQKSGKVFCLSEAPSADAVMETHKEAHGLMPATVILVKQGQ